MDESRSIRALEIALSAMPVGISWATLADQKIVFMNRKFTEIFGFVVGDFVKIADWIGAYPFAEDREVAARNWGAYFTAPDGHQFAVEPMELRIRCKDGTVKTVLNSGVILPEAGWALAAFIDITDRKRDELVLQEAERQARESQSIFHLLLDHAPEMILLSPFDGPRRYVSPAVKLITEFTVEEYLALKKFETIHPLDREMARAAVEEVRKGNLSQVIRHRMLQKEGGYRWVESTINGYLDPITQRAAGYVVTIRDISDQKRREDLLASQYRQLSETAALDELTGIANRRTFNKALKREAARQSRSASDVSLLLLDVDLFKQFNDLYGHLAGDACLKSITETLKGTLRRETDLAARFGGEEFIILMPATDTVGAETVARGVINAIAALDIKHAGCPGGRVSVSIGVASWPRGLAFDASRLLEQTDRALYEAKHRGRNNFQVASW
jgi:diguanylate cyclase (GGDEF)-like protein/PAS domain S-box-containing protein